MNIFRENSGAGHRGRGWRHLKMHNRDITWIKCVTALCRYRGEMESKKFVSFFLFVYFMCKFYPLVTLPGRLWGRVNMFICAFLRGVASPSVLTKCTFAFQSWHQVVRNTAPVELWDFWDLTDEVGARVHKPTVLISLPLISVIKSDPIFTALFPICYLSPSISSNQGRKERSTQDLM